jgi:LPS export ABC transporter protein LptC
MNINLFFVSIFIGLAMIYIFFNPTKLQQYDTKEIAQLELSNFSVYDLDIKGLRSVFSGLKGYKYANRYEVSDINYTDNTKEYTTNIHSDFGIYKDHIVNVQGNVVFARADGLSFKTDEAFYNQNTGILKTPSAYTLYRNNDKITGVKLVFDNKENRVLSKQISATYQIKDNGK